MADDPSQATPFQRRYGPVGKSVQRRDSNDDRIRRFPGLNDYLETLRATGHAADEAELRTRPDLLVDIFHDWVRQGGAGCVFARILSQDPQTSKWADVVAPLDHTEPHWPAQLDHLLRSSYEEQAVLIVLPGVQTIRHLVEAAANICRSPSWSWLRIHPNPSKPRQVESAQDDSEHDVVGLRWSGPHHDKPAWPLAFGPFDDLPFTRRSPIAALTMRTHTPLWSSDGIDLAAMEHGMDERKHARVLERTKSRARGLLSDELVHAARAQGTFRAPKNLVATLMP